MTEPKATTTTWRLELALVSSMAAALFLKLIYSARLVHVDGAGGIVARVAFATACCLIPPLLLLPRRARFLSYIAIDLVVSFVLLADELYFRRYLDLISPADLASAPILFKGFGRSVLIHAFRPGDAWYLVDVIALTLTWPLVRAVYANRRAMPIAARAPIVAAALAAGALAALPAIGPLTGPPATVTTADRLQTPATIGPLPFHLYEWSRRLVAQPEPLPDVSAVRAVLAARRGVRPSDLFGAARGRNLILIQAESLQGFPVGLVVDGQPVTPRLDAFAAESVRFTNFFDQTHRGFTSDGEFTTMTSLHPLPDGSASVLFRTNHFRSLPTLLAERGYETISGSGDDGVVWSKAMMHPNHGFALSIFADRFLRNDGQSLMPDADFFSQMTPRLESRRQPFMAFLISSTNHGPPFVTPDRAHMLRLPERLRADVIGDYLQTVHYFDGAFGAFVDDLRRDGLLDDSVVAVYGDHQAYLERTKDIVRLVGLDADRRYDRWMTDRRIPFLIRLPHGAAAGRRETPTGHLDIAPTLLSVLGVEDGDRAMLGRDATAAAPPFVVFRNGAFAGGNHVYALPDVVNEQPACFEIGGRRSIDCAALEPDRRRAREELAVSDAIVRRDLIPNLVRGPIALTFQDLKGPRPFAPGAGIDHAVVSGFDLWAPAPSGAVFSVPGGRAAIEVRFSPIIDAGARATDTGGAVFEIWSDGVLRYERRVLPADVLAEAVSVPAAGDGAATDIAFVTRVPAGGGAHATWQRVRFVPR